jgi:hypothetical protein
MGIIWNHYWKSMGNKRVLSDKPIWVGLQMGIPRIPIITRRYCNFAENDAKQWDFGSSIFSDKPA